MADSESFTIKNWAEEDRPREKLILKGNAALSDAELLAILLGFGYKDKTAVDLGKELLQSVNNDLASLAKLSLGQLKAFKGIGEAKGVTILAALELGKRRKEVEKTEKKQFKVSRDAYEYIRHHFYDLPHEEFFIILLSRSLHFIRHTQISKGGVAGTVVDSKLLFKYAINDLASYIILCHNHPSGNLTPSQADLELTQKLKRAGETLDVIVLDHLIITNESYYSFADNGLM